MEGTFDYYGGSDVYFAFFNSNTLEELDNIPVKNNGLAFDETKSSCTNGATIEWNDELWAPKILNLTNAKTKCSLYFTNAITVTFDPDGGTLDTLTKEVAYNSSYGYLPTPTKTGYTFKGWNGKNMLDIYYMHNYNNIEFVDNIINFDSSDSEGNFCRTILLQKRLNGTYVSDAGAFYDYQLGYHEVIVSKDNSFDSIYLKLNGSKKDVGFFFGNNFENGKDYIISFNIDSLNTTECISSLSNLQLEQGSTATEWEPYFVTSDVKVTRNTSHTLKAIWEENT